MVAGLVCSSKTRMGRAIAGRGEAGGSTEAARAHFALVCFSTPWRLMPNQTRALTVCDWNWFALSRCRPGEIVRADLGKFGRFSALRHRWSLRSRVPPRKQGADPRKLESSSCGRACQRRRTTPCGAAPPACALARVRRDARNPAVCHRLERHVYRKYPFGLARRRQMRIEWVNVAHGFRAEARDTG